MRRFDTSIKDLYAAKKSYILEHKHPPIFISDWDVDCDIVKFPQIDLSCSIKDANKYYYWTDEEHNKVFFKKYLFQKHKYILDDDNFILASSGTASLFLSILALIEKGVKNILVFTPVYFTTLNIMDEFDINVLTYQLSLFGNIDYDEIRKLITTHNVEAFILTNPLFGTGIELVDKDINQFAEIANKCDCWFIMDYVYGSMLWGTTNKDIYLFNIKILKAISKAKKYIFIESISKRIFFNGAKFALIFSDSKLIRRILRLSIFTVGSMAAVQSKILEEIYNQQNSLGVKEIVNHNIKLAQNNFELIKTSINDNFSLSKTNSGYFTLLTFPKNNNCSDMEFACNLIKNFGIMTTPHSRYLYYNDNNYSCRINLLLDKNKILAALQILQTELFEKR